MRSIIRNTIYLAVFLYAATNLPELQFSMAQAGDTPSSSNWPDAPSVLNSGRQPTPTPTPTDEWARLVEHFRSTEGTILLACNKTGLAHNSLEWIVGYGFNSGSCLAGLNERINSLEPEDFFECDDNEQICEENCDCEAYIDEDCNYAVGGQTPPTRCIYRSRKFPPMYRDSGGRELDFIQMFPEPKKGQQIEIINQKSWPTFQCGFFVEAKGGCKCVSNVTTRTHIEPVITDQQ